MGHFAGEEHYQATADRLHVVLDVALEGHAQLAAVFGLPILVEVDHRRDHAPVVIAKAVDVLAVEGPRWIQGEVTLEVLKAQKQTAIKSQAQAVHQLEVVVARRGQAGLQPLDTITADALADLLGNAPTHGCWCKLALGGAFAALGRQRQGQRLWKKGILLRPATGGQVVDDAQQQGVIRGYVHVAHSIHLPRNPTAPLGREYAMASRQSPARPRQ
ncbi:hypothetical protein D3C79_640360 [compost metagenome]